MTWALLIDAGNQRFKWSMVSLPPERPLSELIADAVFEAGAFACVAGDEALDPIDTQGLVPAMIVASSVAGRGVREQVTAYCRNRWRLEPRFVCSQGRGFGVKNNYHNPAQLGSDRWLAACAAHQLGCVEQDYDAVIVVDAGTAITVDLVSEHCFQGGSILPGYGTIIRTMGSVTGQIRINTAEIVNSSAAPTTFHPIPGEAARNSDDAVTAGAIAAVRGGVRYAVDALQGGLQQEALVMVSGGDMPLIATDNTVQYRQMPNLVLAGLLLAAAEGVV